jgi:hypothetical protein
MEYTVEYDTSSGVCVIRVSGTHKRPEDSYKLLRIAGAYAEEYGCSRFMFDMRGATIIGGTMGAFYTAIEPEKQGFSKLYRIASVYPVITKDHKFMEDVGMNRGAAAFQVFDDIDKAREWLTSR